VDEAIGLAPKYIVVIDAADFGGAPGEVRVIEESAIPRTTLSTHMIPLNVVTGIISEQTGAKVAFIGIQVKSAALGEGLSPEVRAAAEQLLGTFLN
jgi:hydrogenase 3 maturation protease